MPPRKPRIDMEQAETIALGALTFLAQDSDRLGQFLGLTGMGPDDLRSATDEPHTLSAVLDYILADELLLLVFAAERGLAPEIVQPAATLLAGAGDRSDDWS